MFTKKHYTGCTVADGVPGTRAGIQFWNPTESTKTYKITAISIASSYSATPAIAGGDIRDTYSALGTLQNHGFDNIVGEPVSQAEIRACNIAPLLLPSAPRIEYWLKEGWRTLNYPLQKPLIVQPGKGILIADAHDGQYLIATFEFSEC